VQSIAHFAAVGDGGPRSMKAGLSCATGGPKNEEEEEEPQKRRIAPQRDSALEFAKHFLFLRL